MKTLKQLWFVLLFVILVAPVHAQDFPYEDVDPTGQTIVFWYQHSDEREAALQEIIGTFNATNPYGITVQGVFQGGYGDIFSQMLNLLGTADVPELVVAYQNQAATYQLSDGLVDMRALVDSPAWGLTDEEREDYFNAFYTADVFPTFDGARLGFPPNRSAEVMYYNADWLAELAERGEISFDGPPTTPEQFREAACAAAASPFSGATAEGSIGYELSVDASRFASWTFAFGGNVFDYENSQYAYDSEAAVQAMTFLQGVFADGCAQVVSQRDGDLINFSTGTTLFTVNSSSDLPDYRSAIEAAAGMAWDVAPVPHTTQAPVVNIYGASVSIPKSEPESELAAWLFLKYFTSQEAQADWARASNYFPVRASVAENLDDYFAENPAYQSSFDLLQYGISEPPVPGYDFVRDLIEEEMASIMDGASVEETLQAANAAANQILSDQR